MKPNFKGGKGEEANPLEIDVAKLKEKLDKGDDYNENYKLTKVLS